MISYAYFFQNKECRVKNISTFTALKEVISFERKILRKIYRPTKLIDGTWRISTNEELDYLTEHKNIIHFIDAQIFRRLSHVERMPEERVVKKTYKWKLIASRPVGRPKINNHHCLHVFHYIIHQCNDDI
jgi:hypothetical protein